MGNKVSKKKIKSIIKHCQYEPQQITYKCDDEDIVFTVNPSVSWQEWYSAINITVSLIKNGTTDSNGDEIKESFTNGISSIMFNCAVMMLFTNIADSSDVYDLFDLVTYTDVAYKVCNVIPEYILNNFKSDFDRAIDYAARCASADDSVSTMCDKISESIDKIDHFIEVVGNLSDEDLLGLASNIPE